MTTTTRPNFDKKTQYIKILEDFIKAAISYERNIAFHLCNGTAVDTDDEGSIHDFLNEYSGLFDDEYEQLKSIFINHWEENDINISNDINTNHYQCPIEYVKSNYTEISDVSYEVKKLISYLADCQTNYNDAEETVVLTGDEASDKFSDLLTSYGLDYNLYGELYDMEWVEPDE